MLAPQLKGKAVLFTGAANLLALEPESHVRLLRRVRRFSGRRAATPQQEGCGICLSGGSEFYWIPSGTRAGCLIKTEIRIAILT